MKHIDIRIVICLTVKKNIIQMFSFLLKRILVITPVPIEIRQSLTYSRIYGYIRHYITDMTDQQGNHISD